MKMMKIRRSIWRQVGVSAVLCGVLFGRVGAEVLPDASSAAPDHRPPHLLEIESPDATPRSATFAWRTDEASSTRVEYGPTPDYGFYSAPNPTRVTRHSAVLIHLKSETTYHYRLISADAVGNTVYSENRTFSTPPEGEAKAVEPTERHAATQTATQTAID